MPVNDSITSLANATITVKRRAEGTMANGVYVPTSPPTTFELDVVMQPAFNLNRIIGGADVEADVDNQSAATVNVLWTTTRLYTRDPGLDPDVVTYDGADWTVTRVEGPWQLDDQAHYKVVITKQTQGAS